MFNEYLQWAKEHSYDLKELKIINQYIKLIRQDIWNNF